MCSPFIPLLLNCWKGNNKSHIIEGMEGGFSNKNGACHKITCKTMENCHTPLDLLGSYGCFCCLHFETWGSIDLLMRVPGEHSGPYLSWISLPEKKDHYGPSGFLRCAGMFWAKFRFCLCWKCVTDVALATIRDPFESFIAAPEVCHCSRVNAFDLAASSHN